MEWCAAHTVSFLWDAYFSLEVSYSDIEKTFWGVHDPLPKMKNLKMNKMMTIHREIAWVPKYEMPVGWGTVAIITLRCVVSSLVLRKGSRLQHDAQRVDR